MGNRILWNEEEAAILIDYYIQYRDGRLTKRQAIENTSTELRRRAIECGMKIDSTFRNINGIAMQMSKIEDLFLKRKLRLSAITKVFKDMVELYWNNEQKFDEILKKARGMGDEKFSVKEVFFIWLSKKEADVKIPELYRIYDNMEYLCRSQGILKKSLFETVDVAKVENVKNFVDSSRIFQLIYKKDRLRMQAAIKYYFNFLQEAENIMMNNDRSQGRLYYMIKEAFNASKGRKTVTDKDSERIIGIVRGVLSEKLSKPLVDNIIDEVTAKLGRK